MNNNPIGIFDSGIGGLTVFSEIRNKLPNESLIYLGDTKNFPYGNKSQNDIISFSMRITKKLIELHCKAIVIACGTATSQSIDTLTKNFDLPILGIISPTIQYVKNKNISKIGVMATEGTIRSNAWKKCLTSEMPNIQVFNQSCPMLAQIAEEGLIKSDISRKKIKEYVNIFIENNITDIILGCTHYPLYREIIQEEMPYKVNLINTGISVANELSYLLKNSNLENSNFNSCYEKFFITKPESSFKNIAKNILKKNVELNFLDF